MNNNNGAVKPIGFQHSTEIDVRNGWNKTNFYTSKEIEAMPDPEGGSPSLDITSIPSPFARMYLYEMAFDRIQNEASSGNYNALLGGDRNPNPTIYHRLVAEALDVGEILFRFDELNNSLLPNGEQLLLDVVEIPLKDSFEELLRSNDDRHRLLGETYNLFAQTTSGKGIYQMEKLQLLLINNIPVGGTSPLSMFFASPNDLSEFQIPVRATTTFDGEHEGLAERDEDFIYSQIMMARKFPALEKLMPAYYAYVIRTEQYLNRLRPDLRYDQALAETRVNTIYDAKKRPLFSKDKNNGQGPIYLFTPRDSGNETVKSEFTLGYYTPEGRDAQTEEAPQRPLLLWPEYKRKATYFRASQWVPDIMKEYASNQTNLFERFLPGMTGVKYPWLTVSDFLSDTLFQLAGPLNDRRFLRVDSHRRGPDLVREPDDFLIPLKPCYFDYFSREDLLSNTEDGRPVLEIIRLANQNAVKVILRVPISPERGIEYIDLERTYYNNYEPNAAKNDGSIELVEFNLALMPDLRKADYQLGRVMLVDKLLNENPTVTLSFHNFSKGSDNKTVPANNRPRIPKSEAEDYSTEFYLPETAFDTIRVESGGRGNLLLLAPPIKTQTKGAAFDVAVDFGTTNTHVEINERGKKGSEAFSISQGSALLQTLFPYNFQLNDRNLSDLLFKRAYPRDIGPTQPYRFPTRTASLESGNVEEHRVYPFVEKSIPFYYLRERAPLRDKIFTELKWGSAGQIGDKKRLEYYIHNLATLIRYEIVSRGGDPKRTRLVYFYPAAMSGGQVEEISESWKNAYANIFHAAEGTMLSIGQVNEICKDQLFSLSEAVAPYYAVTAQADTSGIRTYNVDIGGGTVDIYGRIKKTDAVATGRAYEEIQTSFLFGGNVLFGDGYSTEGGLSNGFAAKYGELLQSKIGGPVSGEQPSVSEQLARNIYEDVKKGNKSEELISFLFLLGDPYTYDDIILNFSERLKSDTSFKIVFLIYYGAIVYHLAQLLKANERMMPSELNFTGNGSKTLHYLGSESTLGTIATKIFERVYGEDYPEDHGRDHIRVIVNTDPKVATCQGGIRALNDGYDLSGIESRVSSHVLLGGRSQQLFERNIRGKWLNDHKPPTYNDLLGGALFQEIIDNVNDFVDLLFSINDDFPFEYNLRIPTNDLSAYRASLTKNLDANLRKGIERQMARTNRNDSPAGTVFFLPLIGGIHQLARSQARK